MKSKVIKLEALNSKKAVALPDDSSIWLDMAQACTLINYSRGTIGSWLKRGWITGNQTRRGAPWRFERQTFLRDFETIKERIEQG